jgi:endonuclease III
LKLLNNSYELILNGRQGVSYVVLFPSALFHVFGFITWDLTNQLLGAALYRDQASQVNLGFRTLSWRLVPAVQIMVTRAGSKRQAALRDVGLSKTTKAGLFGAELPKSKDYSRGDFKTAAADALPSPPTEQDSGRDSTTSAAKSPTSTPSLTSEAATLAFNKQSAVANDIVPPVTTVPRPTKKSTKRLKNAGIEGEPITGGWDQLPHNLGSVAVPPQAPTPDQTQGVVDGLFPSNETVEQTEIVRENGAPQQQLHEDTKKPRPRRKTAAAKTYLEDGEVDTALRSSKPSVLEPTKRKRKARASPAGGETPKKEDEDFEDSKPARKRKLKRAKIEVSDDVKNAVDKIIDSTGATASQSKRPKKAAYGLTPGISPYPEFPMPTPEACLEVNGLLSGLHGVVQQPATIPPPSLEVTGCGEVPSVLDALVRTRLSAATTATNSGYAFNGLVEKFGILEEGIGKGSVDWSKVRQADVKDIEKAILRGGLAPTKSKSIKGMLEMVHEQNIARRQAFVREKETGEAPKQVGADRLSQGQKDLEIACAEQDVLSLQFMHGLTLDEAMAEFVKYPGIGVKTASCVALFCLQRPSFAVDTHIFRLCTWLGWIPEKSTRDKAFSHLDVRIPNELKYSLHQLMIRHGRTCGRCRASTGTASETYKETVCPIEHLVHRTGKRKTTIADMVDKSVKKENGDSSGSELSELSDMEDENVEEIAAKNVEAELQEE